MIVERRLSGNEVVVGFVQRYVMYSIDFVFTVKTSFVHFVVAQVIEKVLMAILNS